MAGLKLHGYREFQRALQLVDPAARRELRAAFRDVGEGVRAGARDNLLKEKSPTTPGTERTARGYRSVVRARGVEVEQSLRKTSTPRQNWGDYQMRHALLPSLDENEPFIEERMNEAMERVTEYFALVARWQAAGLLPPG